MTGQLDSEKICKYCVVGRIIMTPTPLEFYHVQPRDVGAEFNILSSSLNGVIQTTHFIDYILAHHVILLLLFNTFRTQLFVNINKQSSHIWLVLLPLRVIFAEMIVWIRNLDKQLSHIIIINRNFMMLSLQIISPLIHPNLCTCGQQY